MKLICFHPGALGDIVNTLPALQALRWRWPDVRLTALGQWELMKLLAETRLIDHPLPLDYPGLHTLFQPEARPPETLLAFLKNFDLAISWLRGKQDLFPRRLRELGLNTVSPSGPFPPRPGSGPARHYYAEPIAQLGIQLESEPPVLPLSPEQKRAWLSPHPELFSDPYLVIHPGSGSPAKNWPAENFADLARALAKKFTGKIVVLQGPADERPVQEMISAAKGIPLVVKSGLSLPELAALLARAELVAGNDSGVSHLAGAVGTPTVAIFVSSDPGIWGVAQPRARNLGPGAVEVPRVMTTIAELLSSSSPAVAKGPGR